MHRKTQYPNTQTPQEKLKGKTFHEMGILLNKHISYFATDLNKSNDLIYIISYTFYHHFVSFLKSHVQHVPGPEWHMRWVTLSFCWLETKKFDMSKILQ